MITYTYSYGARIDEECFSKIDQQLFWSREMYNKCVEHIKTSRQAANDFLLQNSPKLNAEYDKLNSLNADFKAAKAINDESAMQEIRAKEKVIREVMQPLWKEARATHKQALSAFYAGVGRSKENQTYQTRCEAVQKGLGSDTADATLDAVLKAWDTVCKNGGELAFRNGKLRKTEVLLHRFKTAGGITAQDFLSREHSMFSFKPPEKVGDRQYGEFKFRLGSAKANTYATGTFEYPRALPDDAKITAVKLVRKRIGVTFRYYLHFQITVNALPMPIEDDNRKPFVAVHLGFHTTDDGSVRIAGIADHDDPGFAKFYDLPDDVPYDLWRVDNMQSVRDIYRDRMHEHLKTLVMPDFLMDSIKDEWKAICKLPAQHVTQDRLHMLNKKLKLNQYDLKVLQQWSEYDNGKRFEMEHLRAKVLNRRKDYYIKFALTLVRNYRVIAVSRYELNEMALRIKDDGTRNELGAKERAKRHSVALYSLISAIKWACDKSGTTFIEHTNMKYARRCACCDTPFERESNWHECEVCGVAVDIKANNAASLYKELVSDIDDVVINIAQAKEAKAIASAQRKEQKLLAMQNKKAEKKAA